MYLFNWEKKWNKAESKEEEEENINKFLRDGEWILMSLKREKLAF